MSVKLLTEQCLEFLSLKGGYTYQNATLLEITCQGSFVFKTFVLSFFEWPLMTGFTVSG